MNRYRTIAMVGLAALLVCSVAAAAIGWKEWKSDKYGFKMQIPKTTLMKAKAFGDGWAGFHGKFEMVNIYGITKQEAFPDLQKMQQFGIKHTGIPAPKWKLIAQGKKKNGWKWYKTYKAEKAGKVVFASLAHGPKGAYIVILSTTPADFAKRKAGYVHWYQSIKAY